MGVYVINEYRFPCWFETHPWTGRMTEVAARLLPSAHAQEVTDGIHAALRLGVVSRDGTATALTLALPDLEEVVRRARRIYRWEPDDNTKQAA